MRKTREEKIQKTRLTLDLTPQQLARLEKLEKRVGTTKAGVVRDAIRLYEYVADRTLQGYSFRAFDKQGVPENVFFVVD